MSNSQETASVRLYDVLESVGLSEEMRLCHRQFVIGEMIDTVLGNLDLGSGKEIYYFGSHSEGSTIRPMKPDVDIVRCDTNLPVVTDVRKANIPESLLMVEDDHTYPGYVKVQRVLYGIPMTLSEMDADIRYGTDVYSRMCFKHYSLKRGAVHGPAIRFDLSKEYSSINVPYDFVPALKCLDVPDSVTRWLHRTRQYGWPPRQCIKTMATLPNLLVGAGHPNSVEHDSEWRISYSLHERELMFSLNPTQHKCYGTMKMIKKDVIEPTIGEESISSYHLKTCLFWAIEKTSADICTWQPNKLLNCLCICFWYLLYFVRTLNCPNYFRPDANLFERKIIMQLQDHLSSEIKRIIQTLPDIIGQIKCADVGKLFLQRTVNVSGPVLYGISFHRIACNVMIMGKIELLAQVFVHVCYNYGSQQERVAILYHHLHKWSHVRRIAEHTEGQTNEARQFILPCLHFRLATCLAAEGFRVNNEPMRQYLIELSILHLTQSSTRDFMGPRLMYVTILYKQGRYHQCNTILQQIDRDLHEKVISTCICHRLDPMFDNEFIGWVEANKLSARSMLMSAIVSCVTFLPCEWELVPEPLQYELNRSRDYPMEPYTAEHGHNVFDLACVDGKVYLHLMKYLVNSQLNSQEEKDASRNDLVNVIDNDQQHRDTAYNVLGWIYAQERRYEDSDQCWKKSTEIRPQYNAAIRHVILEIMALYKT